MVMRQQVWIDQHVQGVLVGRVLLYWSGILIYFGLSIGCFHWWENPDWTLTQHMWAMFDQIWPCLPTLILLLPLVVFDIVRLSNRFAGPIYRLRKHLSALTQDSAAPPLNFRDDDYWQQLAEPINLLQQRLLVLEQQVQTLSFVHQGLNDGSLTAEQAAAADPADANKVVTIQDDFVREQAAHAPGPEESVQPISAEEALTPIAPLPSQSAESFATAGAN